MILTEGNPGKELIRVWQGNVYFRYPVKTHTVTAGESIVDLIENYAGDFLQQGDHIGIAESVISVTQQRAYKFDEIKYGFFAKHLSKFVTRTPAGIGLGTPQTMQLAINEVGLLRILIAAVFALTKFVGIKGMFYRIAGERARGIDGPTENTLPPYNEYASLLPKNPNKVLKELRAAFQDRDMSFCIVDANDLGVNLIGSYSQQERDFFKTMFSDNPLGQGSESTPILIIRKK